MHPEVRQKEEAGEDGSNNRSGKIQRVEPCYRRCSFITRSPHRGDQNRQCRAHQTCWNYQDQCGQGESQECAAERARMKTLPQNCVCGIDRSEKNRDQQRVESDCHLEQSVCSQRLRDFIDQFRGESASQGQAAHECSQHRAYRNGRRAQHQPQHPRPQHFIDKRSRARKDKADRD